MRRTAVEQPGRHAGDRAPGRAIEAGDREFLVQKAARVRRVDLPQRDRAHDQRHRLVAGVARNSRHDRHQGGQRDDPLDRSLEKPDDARREERGAQVDRQPRPAIARRIPDARKQVFLFAQAGLGQRLGLTLFADQVENFGDRHAADHAIGRIDDRRRHQVVALERLRRFAGILERLQRQHVALHHVGDLRLGLVDQQPVERQRAEQRAALVDDEDLVGVIGQFLERAQLAQHHVERVVVANGDRLEVHQLADRVLRIGHRCAQLLALLLRKALADLLDDIGRQVGRELGDLVGVEALDGLDQLVAIHRADQRFADRFGNLEQDLAVALGPDQIPDEHPLLLRQRLQDEGDVGRVQAVEPRAQSVQVLALDQLLDQLVAVRPLAVRLPMRQVEHQLVPAQQFLDLGKRARRRLRVTRLLRVGSVFGVAPQTCVGLLAVQDVFLGHGKPILDHGGSIAGIHLAIVAERRASAAEPGFAS